MGPKENTRNLETPKLRFNKPLLSVTSLKVGTLALLARIVRLGFPRARNH